MPLVYIIVLNWNGWRDTRECIRSLERLLYPNHRIVIVDNASTDKSVAKLKEFISDIKLIVANKNLGFAGGNNLGIREAIDNNAEYVLLLNNDTIVSPNLLNKFVDVANRYPEVGAMAAKIYKFNSPGIIWFAGGTMIGTGIPPVHLGLNEMDQGQYDTLCDTSFINGSAFFAKVKAIRKVGLLEERYFYMYEDVDWTMRYLKAGYRCLYIPQAVIWHKVSQATNGRTPCWWYYEERGYLLWIEIHFPEMSGIAILGSRLIKVVSEICSSISIRHPIRWLRKWKRMWSIWMARIIGIIDYLRVYYGECPQFVKRLSGFEGN